MPYAKQLALHQQPNNRYLLNLGAHLVESVTHEIFEVASKTRRIFSEMLADCDAAGETKGTCAYATFLAMMTVNQFTDYRAIPRGGDGETDGGYFDHAGGHGHYWLEVQTPVGAFILDITADQFGGNEVVVLPAAGNKQYLPGNQELVDAQFVEFTASITQ